MPPFGPQAASPQSFNPMTWWFDIFSAASQPKPAPAPAAMAMNPLAWWMEMMSGGLQTLSKSSKDDFGAPFFEFAPALAAWNPANLMASAPARAQNAQAQNTWADNPWLNASTQWGATQWGSNPWANNWQDTMNSCCWMWPNITFAAFEMPMTAWLVAAGLPYSVAAPTARANAASMDAAMAARQGLEKAMAIFQEPDGKKRT